MYISLLGTIALRSTFMLLDLNLINMWIEFDDAIPRKLVLLGSFKARCTQYVKFLLSSICLNFSCYPLESFSNLPCSLWLFDSSCFKWKQQLCSTLWTLLFHANETAITEAILILSFALSKSIFVHLCSSIRGKKKGRVL